MRLTSRWTRPVKGAGAVLMLAVLGLLAGCGRTEPPVAEAPAKVFGIGDVERREGRLWLKGTQVAASGVLRETYASGTVKAEAQVNEGRLHGPTRGYYPSGRLQVEESFVKGVSDGPRRRFYDDDAGTLKSREEIRDGQLHGVCQRYHPNGQLAESGRYVQGQPDGVGESWDRSGRSLSRVRFEKGRVVEELPAPPAPPMPAAPSVAQQSPP